MIKSSKMIMLAACFVGLPLFWNISKEFRNVSDAVPTTASPKPETRRDLGPIRSRPLSILPVEGGDFFVNDQHLNFALQAAEPHWDPLTVGVILHALRLWGKDAEFPDGSAFVPMYSGAKMVETLLDDKLCIERLHPSFNAFLTDSDYGVRVLSSQDNVPGAEWAEGHADQLLKVVGEIGLPSSHPVRTSSGRTRTIEDIVRDSLSRFVRTQEMEFTAIAYSRWLPPKSRWVDQYGDAHTFADIVGILSTREMGAGSCRGTHVPYALISVLRADEQCAILDEETRRLLRTRVSAISKRLEKTQTVRGHWDRNWGNVDYVKDLDPFFSLKPEFERIMVTGHHLEWIALSPLELRPDEKAIRRAIDALCSDLEALDPQDLRHPKGYLPLTHAARALCLLRNSNPNRISDAFKDH